MSEICKNLVPARGSPSSTILYGTYSLSVYRTVRVYVNHPINKIVNRTRAHVHAWILEKYSKNVILRSATGTAKYEDTVVRQGGIIISFISA